LQNQGYFQGVYYITAHHGDGAILPLPGDGGVEEFHGDPAVGLCTPWPGAEVKKMKEAVQKMACRRGSDA